MAHRIVEPLPTQATGKGADARYLNHMGNSLREFGRCAVALRNVLYQDGPLSEAEFLFMDNHFLVLQMAYLRWKRKHVWPADFH